MRKELEKKVNQAIKLLQSVKLDDGEFIEVAYSGGKDSDVILELAKMAGIPYKAIYRNTTIDPAGTIKHAIDMGAEIVRPKESFFEIVRKKGYPNRFRRFCCGILKEYKIMDKVIVGVRKAESTKRAKLYKEPIICRFYGSKQRKAQQILPILEWTDPDVKEFIEARSIKVHPLYYDEKGMFHVERRLGCMGCPLKSRKKRLYEFKRNPKLVKAWLREGNKYINNHPDHKTAEAYDNVYEYFTREVFYYSQSSWEEDKESIFGSTDYKKLLEDYFGIDLTIE